jgi:hypothetical protein
VQQPRKEPYSGIMAVPTFIFAGGFLIALMMEVVSTFKMSVNSYQITRRNIPNDSFILATART